MRKMHLFEEIPVDLLLDADFFISYLNDDQLADNVNEIIELSLKQQLNLFVSSEIFNEMILTYRAKTHSLNEIKEILLDLKNFSRMFSYEILPVDLDIANLAIEYYKKFGGRRKLHYHDSFHVATAKKYEKIFLTSDKFILKNQEELKIHTINLRKIE